VTLFCLVHGAWHDDACWESLVAVLESRGHDCIAPVLALEDADFEAYANTVCDSLSGKPAPVLVGHSMSSAVIPLVALERPVKRLVYLCPAMAGFPAPPDQPPSRRAGYRPPPIDADGRTWWPRERAIGDLYVRIDRECAERLAARLRPQPRAPFDKPYPLDAPPDAPATFLYARDDELFDDEWSRWISRTLVGVEPVELPGGHFPMLEQTTLLADLLIESSSGPPGAPAD
jgi:pimeloyl-ACP methyl ester carboxylesterase